MCLWLAALSCVLCHPVGSRLAAEPWKLAEITRTCPQIALSCCCLLAFAEGISRGELVLADTPLARAQCPGKLERFQDFQVA